MDTTECKNYNSQPESAVKQLQTKVILRNLLREIVQGRHAPTRNNLDLQVINFLSCTLMNLNK